MFKKRLKEPIFSQGSYKNRSLNLKHHFLHYICSFV